MKKLLTLNSEKTLRETQSNFLVINESNSNNAFCGRTLIVADEEKDGLFSHIRVFCNRYGCSVCGTRKKWIVKKAIERTIVEKNMKSFATLTISPEACASDQSVKYIKNTWNKHRTLQKRFLPRIPSFISVVEFQKLTKNAHLHVLFDEFITFKWLDSSWRSVGGGRVNIKRANSKVAHYMAKYLTKELESSIYGKFRRVSTSRDITLLPKNKGSNWSFINMDHLEAKYILGDSVKNEIKWGENLITGFSADRPLRSL